MCLPRDMVTDGNSLYCVQVPAKTKLSYDLSKKKNTVLNTSNPNNYEDKNVQWFVHQTLPHIKVTAKTKNLQWFVHQTLPHIKVTAKTKNLQWHVHKNNTDYDMRRNIENLRYKERKTWPQIPTSDTS
jgi:hypothetical protein